VDRDEVTEVIVLEGEVRVENRASGVVNIVGAGNTASSFPSGLQQVNPTQNKDIPGGSFQSDQGSLQIEFEDNSGQSKTLHIEFNR